MACGAVAVLRQSQQTVEQLVRRRRGLRGVPPHEGLENLLLRLDGELVAHQQALEPRRGSA
jgi:hypothetical protein